MLPWWPRRCADTPMVAPNPQIRAAGFAAFAIVAAFAGFVVVAAIGEGPQLAPLGPRTLILAGLLLVTGTAAVVVTLRERTDLVRSHNRRVANRRKPSAKAKAGAPVAGTAELDEAAKSVPAEAAVGGTPAVGAKPAPGARPVRPSRTGKPTGKHSTRRR